MDKDFKMQEMDITTLISPDYNPRTITDKEYEELKRSLREFGYVAPILVNTYNNHIIGGNQRWEALKELGYTKLKVATVHITDINEEKALNVRLNNPSGDNDIEKLDKLFQDLEFSGFDATLTGFNTDRLQAFNEEPLTTIPTSETVTTDLNAGLKPETNNKTNDDEYNESIDTEIPEDEPSFDESIADDIETIKCPRCGYELPKH